MSLELGKNGKGLPLQKRIITGYTGPVKPPPEYTKEFNIDEVFDGKDFIWPPSDSVTIRDITSFQVRYIWGSQDGEDLDTATGYINSPVSSINNKSVGYNFEKNIPPYLYWGGDNMASGAECVMVNIKGFEDNNLWDEMPEELKLKFRARWFKSRKRGNCTCEITAYKGGVIVPAYQITNKYDLTTKGAFIYPLANGDVEVYNKNTKQYEKGWYGQAVYIAKTGTYYKINQVDDSIIGLPEDLDIKVTRVSPLSGYYYESGWLLPNDPNKVKHKIWNEHINTSTGNTYTVSTIQSKLTGRDAALGSIKRVMLNSQGTTEGMDTYTSSFGFGFVAGNSEYKGQYILNVNVPSGSTVDYPWVIANASYNTKTLTLSIEQIIK